MNAEVDKIKNSSKVKTIRIVRKNPESGEYSTLAAALSGTDSTYEIHIFEGIYEEYHVNLPRGITIIGYGNVIIQGHLPKEESVTHSVNWSTLECANGAILRNLTITARNLRYPIHADGSRGNALWDMRDCKFIHYGNKEIYDYHLEAGDGTHTGVVSGCSAFGQGCHGGD